MAITILVDTIPGKDEMPLGTPSPDEWRAGVERRQAIRLVVEEAAARVGFEVKEVVREERSDYFAKLDKVNDAREDLEIHRAVILEEVTADLRVPRTVGVAEFLALQEAFLPAVLKSTTSQGGRDQYLIETPEQLAKVRAWFSKTQARIDEFDKHRQGEKGLDIGSVVVQKFIETPGDSHSTIGVLVSASCEVLAAQIFYGPDKSEGFIQYASKSLERGLLDDFGDPESPLFLRAMAMSSKNIFANGRRLVDGGMSGGGYHIGDGRSPRVLDQEAEENGYRVGVDDHVVDEKAGREGAGDEASLGVNPGQDSEHLSKSSRLVGGRIVLNRTVASHPINERERAILMAYGFDPENPRLPVEIEQMSQAIALRACVDEETVGEPAVKELYAGIDWVMGKVYGNGGAKLKPYYLEYNTGSSMKLSADRKGGEALALAGARDLHGHADTMTEPQAHMWAVRKAIAAIKELEPVGGRYFMAPYFRR